MTEEQLKAFLDEVKSDISLQEKLKAAASPEAAIDIAKEAGFAITAEDILNPYSLVSDEELESAAGGYGCACQTGGNDTFTVRATNRCNAECRR